MKLTNQELRKLRDAYNVQKKTQGRRKPDRNGHRIQVTMTFEEWLQVWIHSGKLHLRGNGRGKFCMARTNDLGDYAVGNVEIKACEENSREAKLGRPASACTRDKMSTTRAGVSKSQSHKDSIADGHLALPPVRCPHCSKSGRQGGAMRRHHFDRCKSLSGGASQGARLEQSRKDTE
jgi:hypothetical protein